MDGLGGRTKWTDCVEKEEGKCPVADRAAVSRSRASLRPPPLVSDGVDLGMRRAPQGRDEEPRGSTPGYGVNIRQHEPRKGGPIVVSSI